MKKIVLGVSGSVAAYRACDLARDLMRAGFEVRVCLTDSASKFVTPALFEALTGHPCLEGVFEEPERGRMAHIDWARSADLILVAPATANILAKLAHGVADDMLTTLAVAATVPLVIAPAMNPAMWLSESNQDAIRILQDRGVTILEPAEGEVACGEQGQGKFASSASIVSSVLEVADGSRLLSGKKVLITSGPTQEPIDSVRYLTNRSSGKMGSALARAALQMGAEVTVISGPVSVAYPPFIQLVNVQTALEMHEAALSLVDSADLVIGAAAVADYRLANPIVGKLRRGSSLSLELEPNPDIITDLAQRCSSRMKDGWPKVVAFGAEPNADPREATEKMRRKGVTALAMNDISDPSIGFGSDQNRLILLRPDRDPVVSEQMSKFRCAVWLIEQLL